MNNILEDRTYSAVKSYALKGTLIDQTTYRSLAESKSIDELIIKLKTTTYNEFVSKIEQPYTSKKIEHAVKEHVSKLHFDLIKVSPVNKILASYFLKYIIANLKIVLKGKALNKSYDELEEYLDLYSEELVGRRDLITRALTAENIEDSINTLNGTEFFKDIEKAMQIYKENPKIDIFDSYLDRSFYSNLSKTYTELDTSLFPIGSTPKVRKFRQIIAYYIDSYNILSALRAKLWKLNDDDAKKILIEPTFDISMTALKKIIASESVEEGIKILENTSYNKLIPTSFTNDGDIISQLEGNIRKHEFIKFKKTFFWNSFGDVVSLSIIRLKEFEANNLASIAFGIENKIEPKILMSKIIV
jgi:V/A-type H+-transporting ATPase subunit C